MKRKVHNAAGENIIITSMTNNVMPITKDYWKPKQVKANVKTTTKKSINQNISVIEHQSSIMTEIPKKRSVEFSMVHMSPTVKQLIKVDSSPGTLLRNHDGGNSVMR